MIIENKEFDMNDFFKYLKQYCKSLKKEDYVISRTALDIDKREIIIFEADFNKIDFSLNNKNKIKELIIPTNKIFIEIPKWKIEDNKSRMVNLGGILLYEDETINKDMKNLGNQKVERKVIMAKTLWEHYNKELGQSSLRPMNIIFMDCITTEEKEVPKSMKTGSVWRNEQKQIMDQICGPEEKLKKDLSSIIIKIVQFILLKIERKEYTTYKKWKPSGFEIKEIIYSYEVSKHRRHFWKDSGRFKIPLMSKDQWEEQGYGTDEVVFRDRELRRDVPFKIIGNYLVGKEKIKKEDNRRIKIAKGRILRCEEKLYKILREIFPDEFIKRHDRRKLKGLELDFWIHKLNLAFEYDGEQHFDRKLCEEVFHSDFKALQKRDKKKDHLCRNKGIRLIRIKYDEPLTKRHIKNKLKKEAQ